MQGCEKSVHTTKQPEPIAVQQSSTNDGPTLAPTLDADGKEVYTRPAPSTSAPTRPPVVDSRPPPAPKEEEVEEEDDLEIRVEPGTKCRRSGCGKEFVNDEVNRVGDGAEAVCMYHPKEVSCVCVLVPVIWDLQGSNLVDHSSSS